MQVIDFNDSYVIKGFDEKMSQVFSHNGYTVHVLSDTGRECYNPFVYIKNEQDVCDLLNCIVPCDGTFFCDAKRMILYDCMLYIVKHSEEKTLLTLRSMIENLLDHDSTLIEALPDEDRAKTIFEIFKQYSIGSTWNAVLLDCLRDLYFPNDKILEKDDMNLGSEKSVFFVNSPLLFRIMAKQAETL